MYPQCSVVVLGQIRRCDAGGHHKAKHAVALQVHVRAHNSTNYTIIKHSYGSTGKSKVANHGLWACRLRCGMPQYTVVLEWY